MQSLSQRSICSSSTVAAGAAGSRRAALPTTLRRSSSNSSSTLPLHRHAPLCPQSKMLLPSRAPVACNGLFGLGLPEVAVIAGIAVLVFGPSKLPELGKGLGKTVKSFQTAAKEFEEELKQATKPDELEASQQQASQQQQQQQPTSPQAPSSQASASQPSPTQPAGEERKKETSS